MTGAGHMQLALSLPLLALVAIGLFSRRHNLREAAHLAAAASSSLNVVFLAVTVFRGARPEYRLLEMIPGFSLAFRGEPLGIVFALVASVLWLATVFYAIGYLRSHREGHQARFFACFAVAMWAALGAALAANLFTLFVFYEVLTISTYPLVTHHGTPAARAGGRVYMGILLSASIGLLLLAIVWTWKITGGQLDFLAGGILREPFEAGRLATWQIGLLLGLFAFGIAKAALMPMHRWLPAAMVAPTPVSALLHAVAVVKVGVFSLMKVVVYIFGLELLSETGASLWLAYVAAASVLLASAVALTKDNLKARLAYSTVSQLGYVTLGAALANPAGVIGGSMHIAMHAVGKITLFFCAGAIYVATHKTEVSQMRGLGRRMPLTMVAFFVASLSIIGIPPGGGAWSKWCLALGSAERQQPLLVATLMLSSLLNIAYLLPIPVQAFWGTEPEGTGLHDHPVCLTGTGRGEAPWFCVIPLCLTAAGTVVLFFFANQLYEALAAIAVY